MFAVVVREAGDAAQIDGRASLVSESVAPRVRQAPGFVSALWMSDGAGRTLNVDRLRVGGGGAALRRGRPRGPPTSVHAGRGRRAVQRACERIAGDIGSEALANGGCAGRPDSRNEKEQAMRPEPGIGVTISDVGRIVYGDLEQTVELWEAGQHDLVYDSQFDGVSCAALS